ncbi:MAG: sterol-binding protein [Hyphomicrobiales bacterium]|nr:SCP2 sterol-binding domain-containing protein [Hyphomicrobiales bacterium]PCH51678.1 MAG: sterol-binding protein [Hyphomicrobiales bacterium]
MSIEAIAETMNDKLAGNTDLGATVKFDCGEDGVIFVDGNAGSVSTENKDANCTVTLDKDVLEDLISGDQDPTAAFMTGKLKVDGDMSIAMKLGELF